MGQVLNEDVHSPAENFWFNFFDKYLLNPHCVSKSMVSLQHLLPLPLPATIYRTHVTHQTLFRAFRRETWLSPHRDVLKLTSWLLCPPTEEAQRFAICLRMMQPEWRYFLSTPHPAPSMVVHLQGWVGQCRERGFTCVLLL